MNEKLNNTTEWIEFGVKIPNLNGDGIREIVSIKVPAKKTVDGEWMLTNEALDLIEQTQSRYMGLMTPEEIKALRIRIQYTQRQMSELIQAGEKSYTRWESGRARLSRLVNIILCGIRDGFLPLTYLQTLYEDGSDWYKKVQAYEAHAQKPVSYKILPAAARVEMALTVAVKSCVPDESWDAFFNGNRVEMQWVTS